MTAHLLGFLFQLLVNAVFVFSHQRISHLIGYIGVRAQVFVIGSDSLIQHLSLQCIALVGILVGKPLGTAHLIHA